MSSFDLRNRHNERKVWSETKPTLKATIQFETGRGLWVLRKEFNDHAHLDNYLAYMRKKHGYLTDEVWIQGEAEDNASSKHNLK